MSWRVGWRVRYDACFSRSVATALPGVTTALVASCTSPCTSSSSAPSSASACRMTDRVRQRCGATARVPASETSRNHLGTISEPSRNHLWSGSELPRSRPACPLTSIPSARPLMCPNNRRHLPNQSAPPARPVAVLPPCVAPSRPVRAAGWTRGWWPQGRSHLPGAGGVPAGGGGVWVCGSALLAHS